MTQTVKALRTASAMQRALRHGTGLPDTSRCSKIAASLWDDIQPVVWPEFGILEKLRHEVRAVCRDQGPEGLSRRLVRDLPLVLWTGDPQIASIAGVWGTFQQAAAERSRLLQPLIEAWLRDFGPDRIAHARAGDFISSLLPGTEDPRLTPWRRADHRYALFHSVDGPRNIGNALLIGSDEPVAILDHVGMLDPVRASGNFLHVVVEAMLARLPAELGKPHAASVWQRFDAALRVPEIVSGAPSRSIKQESWRFPDLRPDIVRAALSPWLPIGQQPAHAPKEAIKTGLVRHLGDPRLHASIWNAAGEDRKRLVLSWLASDTVEAFFAFISEENHDEKKWIYRKAFWEACLRKIPEHDAWIILSPFLKQRAAAIRGLAGEHGELDSGSADHQASILIRLGDLVFSEWSSSGPVRAWHVSDPACPKLAQRRYQKRRLQADCLDFPRDSTGKFGSDNGRGLWHLGPKKGGWQGSAAAFIHQRLGVLLTKADYMVIS